MYLDIERIQLLRDEYTDQLVTVDAKIPELTRFIGREGIVQTVTQAGLALVQFKGDDRTHYDIELDYLKVVDRPTKPSSSGESEADTNNDMDTEELLSRLEKARLGKKDDL